MNRTIFDEPINDYRWKEMKHYHYWNQLWHSIKVPTLQHLLTNQWFISNCLYWNFIISIYNLHFLLHCCLHSDHYHALWTHAFILSSVIQFWSKTTCARSKLSQKKYNQITSIVWFLWCWHFYFHFLSYTLFTYATFLMTFPYNHVWCHRTYSFTLKTFISLYIITFDVFWRKLDYTKIVSSSFSLLL